MNATLTPGQQRILDRVRRDGRAVYNGRARRQIEALEAAGLVDVTWDTLPHAKGSGMYLSERITVTPKAARTPNLEDHRFAHGDKVEYATGFSPLTWLGEIVSEATWYGEDGWLIRPLSGNPPQAAQAVYPAVRVRTWDPDRWRYNAQADPPVYGGPPGAWQRVYESAPSEEAS